MLWIKKPAKIQSYFGVKWKTRKLKIVPKWEKTLAKMSEFFCLSHLRFSDGQSKIRLTRKIIFLIRIQPLKEHVLVIAKIKEVTYKKYLMFLTGTYVFLGKRNGNRRRSTWHRKKPVESTKIDFSIRNIMQNECVVSMVLFGNLEPCQNRNK